MRRTSIRNRKGELLLELAAGMTFLVPMLMYCINLATLGVCFQINDSLAHRACRAAATTLPIEQARQFYASSDSGLSPVAAQSSLGVAAFKSSASQSDLTAGLGFAVTDANSFKGKVISLLTQFPKSAIITAVEIDQNNGFIANFPGQQASSDVPTGQIRVGTHMHIKYPFSLPFLAEQDLYARAQGSITTVHCNS